MAPEILAIGALVLAGLFLGLREQRLRKPAKVQKVVKLLDARVSRLETASAGLPTSDSVSDLHDRVQELEQKAGGSAPVQLKVVVDRANQLSIDLTALKVAYDDLKNRFTKLEQGTKWAKAVKGDESRG